MDLTVENVQMGKGATRSTELCRRGGVASVKGRKSGEVASLKVSSNIFLKRCVSCRDCIWWKEAICVFNNPAYSLSRSWDKRLLDQVVEVETVLIDNSLKKFCCEENLEVEKFLEGDVG